MTRSNGAEAEAEVEEEEEEEEEGGGEEEEEGGGEEARAPGRLWGVEAQASGAAPRLCGRAGEERAAAGEGEAFDEVYAREREDEERQAERDG